MKRDVIQFIVCSVIALIITLFTMSAHAQSVSTFKVNGNSYTAVSNHSTTKSEPEKTDYTWTDTKGNTYPIYISSTGSCFVIKISAKTGKEYRNYLKPEVSADICRKLGREYKGKNLN